MAEKMYDQISAYIERKFPISEIPSSSVGETANHMIYSRSLARVYLSNPKYFFWLDKHVSESNVPLVVTGTKKGSKKNFR